MLKTRLVNRRLVVRLAASSRSFAQQVQEQRVLILALLACGS